MFSNQLLAVIAHIDIIRIISWKLIEDFWFFWINDIANLKNNRLRGHTAIPQTEKLRAV